jgi:hypothetical protein
MPYAGHTLTGAASIRSSSLVHEALARGPVSKARTVLPDITQQREYFANLPLTQSVSAGFAHGLFCKLGDVLRGRRPNPVLDESNQIDRELADLWPPFSTA